MNPLNYLSSITPSWFHEMDPRARGALLGGLVGGGAGAVFGPRKNRLSSALAGGLAGAGLGTFAGHLWRGTPPTRSALGAAGGAAALLHPAIERKTGGASGAAGGGGEEAATPPAEQLPRETSASPSPLGLRAGAASLGGLGWAATQPTTQRLFGWADRIGAGDEMTDLTRRLREQLRTPSGFVPGMGQRDSFRALNAIRRGVDPGAAGVKVDWLNRFLDDAAKKRLFDARSARGLAHAARWGALPLWYLAAHRGLSSATAPPGE